MEPPVSTSRFEPDRIATSATRIADRPLRILVLDGDERAALAVVRSLVRAGHVVAVAAESRTSLAGSSRGVAGRYVTPSPLVDAEAVSREVQRIVRDTAVDLLIPVSDASTEAILERRAGLPSTTQLPFASLDVYRAASDKVLVHRLACEVGLGIPETVVVEAHGEAAPADDRLYPGVVKPHRSVVGVGRDRRKTGVAQVKDREECERVLRALPPEAFPVMVQRRIHGAGEGFFTLRLPDGSAAYFAHRRLRERPPSGGVSVQRESVTLDPTLKARCDALLDRLNWTGIAMVECKRDFESGDWRVIEINGRFWGSLQLAIDAGVDFPAILARAVAGLPAAVPQDWRPGVRSRWEWGDIDHLLLRMIRSGERLKLPADAPGRLRTLVDFFTHRAGRDHLEVFRVTDPMPFLVESARRLGLHR